MAPPAAAAPTPQADQQRPAGPRFGGERRGPDAGAQQRQPVAAEGPAGQRGLAQAQQQPQQQRAPGAIGRFGGDANRGGGDDRRDARNDNDRRDSRGDNGRRDDRRPDGYDRSRNDGRIGGGQNWRGDRNGQDRGRPGYNRSGWRNDWRGDRRYDWHGWRDQNRRLFRAPRYVPPRNYGRGYRAFSIGFRLDPYFYAPGYWLGNPWEYRLPPAYGPYRWVRYYNDVLLVDTNTGEVVDAIQNFFL